MTPNESIRLNHSRHALQPADPGQPFMYMYSCRGDAGDGIATQQDSRHALLINHHSVRAVWRNVFARLAICIARLGNAVSNAVAWGMVIIAAVSLCSLSLAAADENVDHGTVNGDAEIKGPEGVSVNGELTLRIPFTNRTRSKIFVRGIETSCRCSQLQMITTELDPGVSTRLYVTLTSRDDSDVDVVLRVYCSTNSSTPARESELRDEIRINASSRPPCRISPSAIVVSLANKTPVTIRAENYSGTRWEALKADAGVESYGFEVKLTEELVNSELRQVAHIHIDPTVFSAELTKTAHRKLITSLRIFESSSPDFERRVAEVPLTVLSPLKVDVFPKHVLAKNDVDLTFIIVAQDTPPVSASDVTVEVEGRELSVKPIVEQLSGTWYRIKVPFAVVKRINARN